MFAIFEFSRARLAAPKMEIDPPEVAELCWMAQPAAAKDDCARTATAPPLAAAEFEAKTVPVALAAAPPESESAPPSEVEAACTEQEEEDEVDAERTVAEDEALLSARTLCEMRTATGPLAATAPPEPPRASFPPRTQPVSSAAVAPGTAAQGTAAQVAEDLRETAPPSPPDVLPLIVELRRRTVPQSDANTAPPAPPDPPPALSAKRHVSKDTTGELIAETAPPGPCATDITHGIGQRQFTTRLSRGQGQNIS